MKTEGFDFETKTEQALDNAISIALEEGLDDAISSEYARLNAALSNHKSNVVNNFKARLMVMLENEIVKRYFYREGMYEYFIANNLEIKRAQDVLNNTTEYRSILGD